MSASSSGDSVASPVLSASELADMATFGTERATRAGDLLFQAGDASYDLFVVLEGEVQVVRPDGADEIVVAEFGPGSFIGELTLLTGQRRFLTGRVSQPGRVLVIAQAELRRLMSVRPALSETIFNALLARRESLRSGEGAQAIRIVGSRYSPEAMSLRSFAEHSHLAHTWIDVEDVEDLDSFLAPMGLQAAGRPGGDYRYRDSAPSLARDLRGAPRLDLPAPHRATSSIWWSSAAARPGSPPPSTAPRRVCAPSPWTRWPSVGKPARARGSRTTRDSRTASPGRTSPAGPPCRRCDSELA